VRRFAEEQRRNTITLTPAAVIAIENYQWPGNVRELENCIKRAVIMADGVSIGADDLELKVESGESHLNLRQVRDEAERKAVNHALARADGNVSKAAEALGISRPTLYELLERFGLR
jgi:two-component system, NtrC family, response regulator